MSTKVSAQATSATFPTTRPDVGPWDWVRGAFGGFVGSIAFGLIMVFIIPKPVLEVAIPNMYGIEATPNAPAPGFGWFFHQFHGLMLGLAYVAYAEHPSVASWSDPRTIGGAVLHGIIWGVVTTLVLAVLVMPIWLQTVGFGGAPPFPNLGAGTLLSTLGHIVYALPLGLLYAFHRG
jgi:hypothetical protein